MKKTGIYSIDNTNNLLAEISTKEAAFYKVKYVRTVKMTIEGRETPIDLSAFVTDLEIIKNFAEHAFPYVKLTFILTNPVRALLADGVTSDQLKFQISVTGFKNEDKDAAIVSDIEKSLYGNLVLEPNSFPTITNPGRLPASAYDEGAENKQPRDADAGDTREPLNAGGSEPITIYLFSPYDNNRKTYSGNFQCSVKDLFGYLVSEFKQADRTIIGKLADHCGTVVGKGISIPPSTVVGALRYLNDHYGLYTYGLRIFKDFKSTFVYDHTNPPEADMNQVVIEVVDDTKDVSAICYDTSGTHVIRISKELAKSPTDPSQAIRNVLGDRLKFMQDKMTELEKMLCLNLSDYMNKLPGINFLRAAASLGGVKTRYYQVSSSNPCIVATELTKLVQTFSSLEVIFTSANIELIRCPTVFRLRSMTDKYKVDSETKWVASKLQLYFPKAEGYCIGKMTLVPAIQLDNSAV